jgi:HSP20 family protein
MSTVVTKPETSPPRTWFRRGPWSNLREDLEDLFSNIVAEGGEGWLAGRMLPSLDLSETDTAVEVRMDVPGMKPEELDIRINGNTLNVSGERKEEKQEKGRTFHRVERRQGSFTRSVTLPCAVKTEKVEAQYRDGVLTICMPKCEAAKAHKVAIKS